MGVAIQKKNQSSVSTTVPLIGITVEGSPRHDQMEQTTKRESRSESSSGTVNAEWLRIPQLSVSPQLIARMQEVLDREAQKAAVAARLKAAISRLIRHEEKCEIFLSRFENGNFTESQLQNVKEDRKELSLQLSRFTKNKKDLETKMMIFTHNLEFARNELVTETRELLLRYGAVYIQENSPSIAAEGGESEQDERAESDTEIFDEDRGGRPGDEEQDSQQVEKGLARKRLLEARGLVRRMQINFDQLPHRYQENLKWYTQAVEAGTSDETRTDFDLNHVFWGQEATRALIDAEVALSIAAAEAHALGAVERISELSSRFPDEPEDEDGLLEEVDNALSNFRPERVEKWRIEIDKAELMNPEEIPPSPMLTDTSGWDDWDAVSLIAGESISGVAEGRDRVHIERWNRLRTEDWLAMLQQDFEKPLPSVIESHAGRHVHNLTSPLEDAREVKRRRTSDYLD